MKYSLTRKLAVSAFLLFCAAASSASAAPVTITGPTALALAAVVAQHSPHLPAYDKKTMARLFAGDSVFLIGTKAKFSVTVDTAVCRTSNVDIAARSCELTFKVSKKTIKGREANEVYATSRPPASSPKARPDRTSPASRSSIAPSMPRKSARRPARGAQCSFETGK